MLSCTVAKLNMPAPRCVQRANSQDKDLTDLKAALRSTCMLPVVQRAYQHRGGEMKGLKAALRSRDQQLQIVERKLRQLRDVANHDTQEVAEQFGKLKSEGQIHFFWCSIFGRATFWVLQQISSIPYA